MTHFKGLTFPKKEVNDFLNSTPEWTKQVDKLNNKAQAMAGTTR